jgi:hypothetical protein
MAADAIPLPDNSRGSWEMTSSERASSRRCDRTNWLAFSAAFAVAFTGYWLTLAPDVTLEWSGLMATGAAYAGVPMAPGYPVWTLYSWLFTQLLPFSNIAWRVAVGSAVAGAVTSGFVAIAISRVATVLFENVTWLGHLSLRQRNQLRAGSGIAAGLVLAFSGIIWSEAVIADFWALSVCLFTATMASLTYWILEPQKRRFLYAAFLLFGLLLTSSQEIIVALPGFIVAMMITDRKLGRDAALGVLPVAGLVSSLFQWGIWTSYPRFNWPLLVAFAVVALAGVVLVAVTRGVATEWKAALACIGCLFAGLSFYLHVPLAAMTTPPVNHGYARTVEGFFYVLHRGQFEIARPATDLGTYLTQLWFYVLAAGKNVGWPQLALTAVPFFFLLQIGKSERRVLLCLLLVWVGAGPLMVAVLNPPPDRGAMELAAWYCQYSYVVLAICLGFGLMILGGWMTRPKNGLPTILP